MKMIFDLYDNVSYMLLHAKKSNKADGLV